MGEENLEVISKKTEHSKNQSPKEREVKDYPDFLNKGKDEFYSVFEKPVPHISDFENHAFTRTLGIGAFGRVMVAKNCKTGEVSAVKIIRKEHVVKRKQVNHVWNEVKILYSVRFPFVVHMKYFHKDNSYIYCFMPFISGGDMFVYLRKMRKFSEHQARFYTTQVVLAFEYLHHLDLVYRDLKPENILIDCTGYLKLTDFGFAKVLSCHTWTICGTPEYFAPEIIMSTGYRHSVDWWSLGVLIYEMNAGYPPFRDKDQMKLHEKIISCKYTAPNTFSEELKDLVKNLLQVDLTRRYGCMNNGVNDVKSHKWFKSINWLDIVNQKIKPPYVPKNKSISSYSNFERYEEENMEVSDIEEYGDEFQNF